MLQKLRSSSKVSDNKISIGWTCSYLPLEILEALGFMPVRIVPEADSQKAEAYLDPNFCPYIKACLGKALAEGYAFLSGIIILNTCDGMRRLFDAWRHYCKPGFSFLLDLPRVVTQSSIAFFANRLRDVIQNLRLYYEVELNDECLRYSIHEANKTRELIRGLFSLLGNGKPPLRYSDIMEIVAEGWKTERILFNAALENFLGTLGNDFHGSSDKPRLFLTGSILEGRSLIDCVEELGGEVVGVDSCTAGRFSDNVTIGSDNLMSLSRAYLGKPPCARMHDTERRLSYLKQELKRAKADGLIYFSQKFCDPYLYELPAAKNAMRSMGIPVLFIEGEYTGEVSGGVRTRIQAFLELLGGNEKKFARNFF